ncbi:unnamed protein product [Urochloa humidicola]
MELQSSRRRLGTQSPRGSPRSCRSGDDEEVDCISGLHDDLLIQILLRLHCAATAARTSALSRRWRESSLWRHLPVLSFRGIAPSALEAALAQVALPKLSLLDIAVPDLHPPSAEAVDSMLRSAARLNPVEFSFAIFWEHQISIEVPSFSSTTSISLNVNHPDGPDPTLLPVIELSGEFPALERLSITSGRLDTAGARCPQLRVLEFINCQGHDTMTVHSETVEELLVTDEWLLSIDIVAPLLKRFTLSGSRVLSYFEMSLLAPRVENLSWNCPSRWWIGPKSVIGIDELGMWHLYDLTLRTERGGFVLGLDIRRPPQGYTIDVRDLQEMFQFPKISALELCLCAHGHVYGAVVLQLLRVCNAVQRLKLRTVILDFIRLIYRIREICLITFLDVRIGFLYDVLFGVWLWRINRALLFFSGRQTKNARQTVVVINRKTGEVRISP